MDLKSQNGPQILDHKWTIEPKMDTKRTKNELKKGSRKCKQ